MIWITRELNELLVDAQPGFACGEDDPSGVFQFRMNNLRTDGTLDFSKLRRVPQNIRNISKFHLSVGDVLFNATNSPELVGKTAFFPGHHEIAVYSNHFVRLRPKDDLLEGRYLAHWLQCQFQHRVFQSMCRQWVNQATVSREALLQMPIPLPPIAEQKRIATILDKAESLRSLRRQALAQLNALTQSIFLEMFGDPATNLKGWAEHELQKVVKQGTIVTYGIVQAGEEFPGGVPYIRTGDIVDGEIELPELRRTDPQIAAKFDRSKVNAGDIVISIRATVGTTALVPSSLQGANLTQGTARIAPGGKIERLYLLNFLRATGTQHWIARQVKGATFREITLARLRELPVLLPPLSLQQEFARRMEAVDRLKAAHRESLTHLDALFASLQHRAFRGEL